MCTSALVNASTVAVSVVAYVQRDDLDVEGIACIVREVGSIL